MAKDTPSSSKKWFSKLAEGLGKRNAEQEERDRKAREETLSYLARRDSAVQDALDDWQRRRNKMGESFNEPPPVPYYEDAEGRLRPRVGARGPKKEGQMFGDII